MTDKARLTAGADLRLEIPSEVGLVDLVHAAVERIAALCGFEEGEGVNVALAVREAVINAIQHGNGSDPDIPVKIELEVTGDGLRASVLDRGDGFDPARIADPTKGPNLLATSGRGLLLIRAFVDEVQFNRPAEGGTEIVLVKRRDPDEDD